ncbi:hypothetical protein G9A89_003515 [Geosiphon pyriformis]|nr:hypothetical protein G9A89_003515 [Geosiphon pyriformis]
MSHYHNCHIFHSNAKTVERNFFPWEHRSHQTKTTECELITIGKWNNKPCLACGKQLLDEGMWNNILGREGTCDTLCQYTILISDWMSYDGYLHNEEKIWRMANAKVEGATPSEILKIKNNLPEPVDIIHIPNPDAFMDKKTGPEDFHKYYQNLAPTREEQKHSCASELESPFNPDLNSDNNDDKNTGSSFIQIGNNNDNNSNSDSNSDPKYEQYIALPNLFKEQKLK